MDTSFVSEPSYQTVEREMYASRFRRNLNGLMKSINNPRKALQRVVVKSRRTQQSVFVAVSPAAYTVEIDYLKTHRQLLEKPS